MTARKVSATATDVAAKEEAPFVAVMAQTNATGLHLTGDQWSDVEDWDTLSALMAAEVGDIIAVEEIGSGFVPVEKDTLIGKAFLILDVLFKGANKDNFGEYVVVRAAILPTDPTDRKLRKVVFADGGTGIRAQLEAILKKFNRKGGISCPRGLSRSDYTYTDEKGQETPATTFYLDESPV